MIVQKQIAAIKYMIFRSSDSTDLAKRMLIFLVDQSQLLTKEVCLTLTQGDGFSKEELESVAKSVDKMCSMAHHTHLNTIAAVTGAKFKFSYHYGDFDPTREGDPFSNAGQFAGCDPLYLGGNNVDELVRENMPLRYTFWLAQEFYSRNAELVTANRKELENIDLARPGLMPEIEPFR